MTFTSDYRDALNQNQLDTSDAEEVTWFVIESLAEGTGLAGFIKAMKHMREIYGLDDDDDHDIVPNPYFKANGHSGQSPGTRKYLTSRGLKGAGGSLLATAGSVASAVTVVDVVGIAQHGSATGSTLAHMMNVKATGNRFKKAQAINRWVDAIIKAKSAKTAVRGSGLAAAAIPVPALGLGVGIGTTIAKLGIKLTLGKLVARTAMEVHWRAYQEQKISGFIGQRSTGAVGPGSEIFTEIFTRRGLTRVFGKYDVDRFIREPGGWIALNDKLMLM